MALIGNVMKAGSSAVLVTSILSLFLGASLTLLWDLINTIQILIYMPLMSLNMPSFLFNFYLSLNAFNLDFFNFEGLISKLLPISFE
jgi:hypothetical protein